ncbi:hypothetical protein Z043_109930, partial [Scleropages formosus]
TPPAGAGAPMMPQMIPQPMMRPQFPGSTSPRAPMSPGMPQSPRKPPPPKDPLADLNIKDFFSSLDDQAHGGVHTMFATVLGRCTPPRFRTPTLTYSSPPGVVVETYRLY